ncbi:E3 ubiquitin-protein ligase MARCHF2-like [Hydractinia symbiolongicarpus]|uniref:E3 ubiquitin-protein ligase MARCHF2-like n=1 Tax=Hydractinia symbiolongicarpus TaxID=13093 RepID=UPI00254A413D|nr:E3 ubiquitin-protein ligase MARCHF2-like [Hydractinia symbiolongicarpus]
MGRLQFSSNEKKKSGIKMAAKENNDLSRDKLSGVSLSTISTRSSGVSCRICQDSRVQESLISPCYCMGTMEYVHSSCLEKWLSQSARKYCELCKYKFKTIMTSKGFKEWLCARDISRMERRYMFADSSCFMLLTPLGFTSSWLCITGAQQYYSNDEFWTGFGLVMLTGFLTIIYLFWIAITLRYHYTTFRQWQRSHTEVRLVFSNKDLNEGEQHVRTHRRTISLDAEVFVIDCDQIDNQPQPINDLQSQAITPV